MTNTELFKFLTRENCEKLSNYFNGDRKERLVYEPDDFILSKHNLTFVIDRRDSPDIIVYMINKNHDISITSFEQLENIINDQFRTS